MRAFYIVANPDKAGAMEAEREIREYLTQKGAVCAAFRMGRPEPKCRYTDPDQVPEGTECIITIGGDGTLIQAARDLAGLGIPFVGVNRGHLGYLTQVSGGQELKDMLNALLEGRFCLESRMMLEGQMIRGGRSVYQDIALNEVVISRRETLKALHFRIMVNGQFLNRYTADGMIIATPTGSTAYNLSAGGPIVAPETRMMVLTPICSHSLNARSIVLGAEDEITVVVEDEGSMASFDGNPADSLCPGDQIVIRRSPLETVLVQLRKISFLQNLSSKMAGV